MENRGCLLLSNMKTDVISYYVYDPPTDHSNACWTILVTISVQTEKCDAINFGDENLTNERTRL